jgi:hypothetical protein
MPIYYTVIQKPRSLILSEFTNYSGNFMLLARQLFGKVQEDTRKTFELDE